MNSLDNKIKQRFADEALAPSPASQDALWAAIDGQMSGRKRAGILWWTGGIFIAALSFVAAWYFITPASAQQLGKQGAGQEWAMAEGYAAAYSTNHVQVETASTAVEASTVPTDTQTDKYVSPVELDVRATHTPAVNTHLSNSDQPLTPQGGFSAKNTQGSTTSLAIETSLSNAAILRSEIAGSFESENFTADLLPLQTRVPNAFETLSAKGLMSQAKPLNATMQRPWNLRIHSGPNWSSVRYDSGEANDYQQADMGWGTGIGIDVPLKNKLGWTAGLDYNTYYHQFDFERTWQDSVILEDQVIETHINAITGDTVEVVYGDLMAIRTNYRRVLHHNKYQVLSIPLGARFETGQGGWTVGCAFEAVLHLRLQAQGRGLNPEGVVTEYSNDAAPQSSVALGWQVRPYLGVQLAPEWRAEVALRYGGFSNTFEGGKTSTRLGGMSLGLVRQF